MVDPSLPMPVADLVLTGGTLVTETGVWPDVCIAVREGKIATLGLRNTMPAAREVLDVSGCLVLPGVVDAHVHFREPGIESKEGFEAGSGSAALGGVTSVIDMPNTEPPTDTADRLREKVALVSGQSWVDFACHALLGADRFAEIEELHAAGAAGFKCFVGQSESGPGCPMPPDDGALLDAMAAMGSAGIRLSVHAENHTVMQHNIRRLRADGARDLAAHRASRPPVVEVEAIQRVGLFAEHTGCPVHILHVSSADGLAAVRAVAQRGVDITAETCPHYLFLADDPDNIKLRVNPPIRGAADARALADGLRLGHLQLIASDHAPHRPDEKEGSDVWQIRAGLNGVQHMLALLVANRERLALTLPDIVRITSFAPSRVWGLWPRKGTVAVGSDADLVIVDPDREWTVREQDIYSRNRWSPYLGHRGRGAPVTTVLRGQVIARDGLLVGQPSGRWLPGSGAQRRSA